MTIWHESTRERVAARSFLVGCALLFGGCSSEIPGDQTVDQEDAAPDETRDAGTSDTGPECSPIQDAGLTLPAPTCERVPPYFVPSAVGASPLLITRDDGAAEPLDVDAMVVAITAVAGASGAPEGIRFELEVDDETLELFVPLASVPAIEPGTAVHVITSPGSRLELRDEDGALLAAYFRNSGHGAETVRGAVATLLERTVERVTDCESETGGQCGRGIRQYALKFGDDTVAAGDELELEAAGYDFRVVVHSLADDSVSPRCGSGCAIGVWAGHAVDVEAVAIEP